MKTLFLFICISTASITCFSQTDLPSFGKADMKELLMKECAFEKEANAMKLFDILETEIFINGYNIRVKLEKRVRIKIFNKSGVDAANIILPYMRRSKKSKVNDISAYIFNLDSSGKNIIIQKLEKNQIFKEKSDNGFSTVAFTFPDVKPGSVIEYRYTHIEKNSLHLDPWFFQDKIPTALSVCKFMYPPGMRFDYRFITTDSVTKEYIFKQGRNMRTFTLKNVFAFRAEPMMSSVKDNLQRVEFAFLPTMSAADILLFGSGSRWGVYNKVLLMAPFFGEQIRTKLPGAEFIVDSAKKIPLRADRVHYVYTEVKKNLKWDDTYSFYADDLKKDGKTNLQTALNLILRS